MGRMRWGGGRLRRPRLFNLGGGGLSQEVRIVLDFGW